MVFGECPCIGFGQAYSSFFLALEKYSNAVKHVLMFIFIIRVGAVGKVERGLMVFKFPRVERDSSVNRPT